MKSFDVALGTEAMWLSARVLRCEAYIPGIANAFPEICKKMYQEGMEGRYEECRTTQFQVNKMRDIMYLAKSTQLAIYAMLEIRGIVTCYPRKPFVPASRPGKREYPGSIKRTGDDLKWKLWIYRWPFKEGMMKYPSLLPF